MNDPEQKIKEELGKMLIDLISFHKLNCSGEACTISTYSFLKVFEDIVTRKATKNEIKLFL